MDSNTTMDGLHLVPNFANTPLLILTFLVIITSLTGNTLLLYTLYKVMTLRMTSSHLVVNLAIVDFLAATFILPTIFVTLLARGWNLSRNACIAAGFFDAVLTKAQIMALLNIGINRYTAVHYPTFYATTKNRRISKRLVLIGWLYSLAWSLPPIFGVGSYSHEQQKLFCGLDWSGARIYGVLHMALGFVVPSCAGLVIYTKVLLTVFRHVREVGVSGGEQQISTGKASDDQKGGTSFGAARLGNKLKDPEEQARENDVKSRRMTIMVIRAKKERQDRQLNQITKVFLIIVLTFAVCWVPRGVANIWALVGQRDDIPLSLDISSTILIFSTCAINPVVYGYYRTDIRQGFKTVLCCYR